MSSRGTLLRGRGQFAIAHMTEMIKVEVDESLAKRFRRRALEKYGFKKGAMKKALEEAMRKYSSSSKADWGALSGTLKLGKDSVRLQHRMWDNAD